VLRWEIIEIAKKISPNINFRYGEASCIPFEEESFDIVMQFTVFTSILDEYMKKSIAREMLRVLKPDGIILKQTWRSHLKPGGHTLISDYIIDNKRHFVRHKA